MLLYNELLFMFILGFSQPQINIMIRSLSVYTRKIKRLGMLANEKTLNRRQMP